MVVFVILSALICFVFITATFVFMGILAREIYKTHMQITKHEKESQAAAPKRCTACSETLTPKFASVHWPDRHEWCDEIV